MEADNTTIRDEVRRAAEFYIRGGATQDVTVDIIGRIADRLIAERDALKALASEMLSHFDHRGHPGEPCRRTGWITEERIAIWRATLDNPAEDRP